MANGWLWFFGLLWAYLIFVFWLVRSGKMQQWNLSLMLGFILMIRTQKGKTLLDRLGRARWFWNPFGDLGIAVVLFVMVGFTFLMFLTLGPSLDPESGIRPAGADEIFVLPGINPILPLWYGLLGLIITLVVHEGGHGVLARANDLRVKSLGLLFAIVPIGAFVEPDEDEIKETSIRKRLRVFSAGPMVNVVVGLLVLGGFAAMVGAASPLPGAAIGSVTVDGPADLADLVPGDRILAIDDDPTTDWDALGAAIDGHAPGDTVNATSQRGLHEMTLASRWDSLSTEQRAAIEQWTDDGQAFCKALYNESKDWGRCADLATQDAVMGVGVFRTEDWQATLTQPFGEGGRNFITLLALPIGEVRGQPVLSSHLPTFLDTPFQEDAFWITANVLFWTFWLNILVGTFNALPMLPLDGGHIFRDSVAAVVHKVRPGMEREARDRFIGRAAAVASLSILAMILISILGPRIAPLL